MPKLTPRQEKIAQYLRANGTLHKGRYAVKSEIAYKCAQFFELAVLQKIGTITYNPEQHCYYINAAPPAAPRESWDTEGIADYMPDVESEANHGHWHPSNAEKAVLARTRYFDARRVADELRASARTHALTMAPGGMRQLQNSVDRFYEAVELEARRGRELFDLLEAAK